MQQFILESIIWQWRKIMYYSVFRLLLIIQRVSYIYQRTKCIIQWNVFTYLRYNIILLANEGRIHVFN